MFIEDRSYDIIDSKVIVHEQIPLILSTLLFGIIQLLYNRT